MDTNGRDMATRTRVCLYQQPVTRIFTSSRLGRLCLTSHRQRGHLETAPPFTVPCEGREAR